MANISALGNPHSSYDVGLDLVASNNFTTVMNSTLWTNVSDSVGKGATPGSSSSTLATMRFVLEGCIAMPIAVVGIVGNVLAFIVLWRQKQRLTTNVLLQALCVADCLVLITFMLLNSIRYLEPKGYKEQFHHIFIGVYPCTYFFRLVNIWLTVLLTIDRYIAVCLPLHAQRICTMPRTYRNIGILISLAFAFSLPRFFEYKYMDNQYGFGLTELILDKVYTILYRISLFFIFMYLLPMCLLIVLNVLLLRALWRADSYRNRLQETKSSNTSRSVTSIVVAVVLVCIFCNMAAMASHLLWSLHECFDHLNNLNIYRRYISHVSNVLVAINSAANFFIYCLCSRNFRSVFIRTFCHRHHPGRHLNKGSTSRSSNATYLSLVQSTRRKRDTESNIYS